MLLRAYRATGADLPFGRPERAHGVPFEGYYWRIVHPERGLVVVAIGADCDGATASGHVRPAASTRKSWGMATLAAHPGGFVRTSVEPSAVADPYAYGVTVGRAFPDGVGKTPSWKVRPEIWNSSLVSPIEASFSRPGTTSAMARRTSS